MTQKPAPLIVDLGRASKKKLRALQDGGGVLADEIGEVMQRLHAELGDAANDRQLVPVVVIFRRKRKASKPRGLLDLLL